MKPQRSLEIGTGLFVLLGFAALFFLTTQLPGSGLSLGEPTGYRVTAKFDNVGDLKVGSPVSMAGVELAASRKSASIRTTTAPRFRCRSNHRSIVFRMTAMPASRRRDCSVESTSGSVPADRNFPQARKSNRVHAIGDRARVVSEQVLRQLREQGCRHGYGQDRVRKRP